MFLRIPVFPLSPKSSAMPHRSATKRTKPSDLWVLSWSTTKIQVASGSPSTVRVTCATKSSSVRVGPMVGVTALPVTTSKFAMRQRVPWRRYSNSMRSVSPGRVGSVGWRRSRAWMPVFSSVLTTWPPCSWIVFASAYVEHTLRTSASYCSGSASLSFDVSQYWVLCGRRSPLLGGDQRASGRSSRRCHV